mmetsp:Transcript_35925/g.103237  ORF Transcript_35925/g.103237 Transcript_35925/m.103237 type:complete len:335 (-) Transcript_35925:327-1331(-)
MRVHDEVGAESGVVEWHVLLVDDQPHHALLPVTRRELVTQLGAPRLTQNHLVDGGVLVVGGEDHTIHIGGDGRPVCDGCGFEVLGVHLVEVDPRLTRVGGGVLVDVDLPVLYHFSDSADAVVVEYVELARHTRRAGVLTTASQHSGLCRHLWWGEDAVLRAVGVTRQRSAVPSENVASSESPVEAGTVHDDGVLDVIRRVAHDGDAGVLAGRQLLEVDKLDGFGFAKRFLRVDEEVEQRVAPCELVGGDGPHGLLAHGTLVGVARTLVVVGVGDEPRHDPHDGQRVNLQVSRLPLDIGFSEGDEQVVLLIDVNPLQYARPEEVVKVHLSVSEHV